jgi:hypothetical protein
LTEVVRRGKRGNGNRKIVKDDRRVLEY